jgi:hypothetical protein
MPKPNVTDPITDQEIAFAHLVFSGTMTDRQAAEAVGLNPDTAAYIKSKPRVRAYMLEHRAAGQQQLVEQDSEELRRYTLSRDRVLARLWEIADLDPEKTRNGMSAQVKALSMIIAIEGLIPSGTNDRRAVSAQNKPAPPPAYPPFYVSQWMRTQRGGESVDPQPPPPQEVEAAPEPQSAPGRTDDPPPIELSSSRPERTPDFLHRDTRDDHVCGSPQREEHAAHQRHGSRQEIRGSVVEGPAVPGSLNPSQTTSSLPRVPMADYVAPDTRRPFSRDNRFRRRQ